MLLLTKDTNSLLRMVLCLKFDYRMIGLQRLYMKNQIQKNSALKDDQKFLEGINLITGDKIDYAKHLLTETEVNAMCVNQKLCNIDKFMYILTRGEKIQKWSIFQNLPYYVETAENAQRILLQIEKNYHEYEEFITIMGQGLHHYLLKAYSNPDLINAKCYDSLYRLLFRTVTAVKYQGSDILNDWMMAITVLFQFPQSIGAVKGRKSKINELKQYINGSFSMSTLPQRRKTALQLINALLNLSQQIEKQTDNKIMFFNSDLNPSTRLVICNIMHKILQRNSHNMEIWKCVHEYYYSDKSRSVKERAFQILTQIYCKSNAELVFQQFANEESEYVDIIIRSCCNIFVTFKEELKKESSFQFKVISFLNRLLRKNFQFHIGRVIESYKILLNCIPQSVLVNELQLNKFDLQNQTVIFHLIFLHGWIGHLQFKDEVKKQILKGIRYHEFDLKIDRKTMENLLQIFDLTNEEEVTNFTLLFGKQVDSSRWKNIELFLDKIPTLRLYQTQYQRIMASIIKIYQNCPYFLIDKIHSVVLFLILNDRKNMEMYQKIKEKYLNSRSWSHRRNYIKLYAFLKMNASFQFNRLFPPLMYKTILNEKIPLIKQQFLKEFQKAYSFFDPTLQQEKNTIKQVVTKMMEDKDRQVSAMAQNTLDSFKESDKDYELIHKMLVRNKEVYEKELQVQQVQSQTKKHIKTQKIISKQSKEPKLKKSNNIQVKTSLNLTKLGNVDHNKTPLILQSKLTLKRSSSSQTKKDNIKFNLPAAYKKSRF